MSKRNVFLIILLLFPALAFSEPTDQSSRPPSVTASGEAVITVEPDQAEIDIGVVTQAKSAPEAARENSAKLARVMAEVQKIVGKGDEVKTASYALTPNYRYPPGGRAEITGYTATNILRIKTTNLPSVGRLIDTAMQSGANTIHRLLFTLKDEQSAQLQALREASAKAKAKAEGMASALRLKVVRILAISEGERGIRPLVMAQAGGAQVEAMAAAPTPVEAGTIEVRSSVTLTAELGSK